MATIDSLVIEIDSNASQASQGIDKLAASLRGLKAETSGQIKGLNGIANSLKSLGGAFKDIEQLKQLVDSGAIQSLNEMTNALQNLSSLNGLKLSTSIANQITAIGNAVKGLSGIDFSPVKQLAETMKSAAEAVSGVRAFSEAASALNSLSLSTQSLSGAAESIKAISEAAGSVDESKVKGLETLAASLQGFNSINDLRLSSSIANQIRAIAEAVQNLSGTPWEELEKMARALAPLANIQKSSGLNSTINALRKLPDAIEAIKDLDPQLIADFTERIEELVESLQPLADEMRDVSAGFSALPGNIRRAIRANQSLTSSNRQTSRSTSDWLRPALTFGIIVSSAKRAFQAVMDVFEQSNRFEESINLSKVAMGKYADEAQRYAQTVEDVIGINQADWLSNQGVFNQMLTGFGIDQASAARMSKQLTQLGYDIQSVFNLSDVNQAMDRLQSGLAGQIKGMREYGVELSVGAMKEYALSKGITKSWTEMSQAEKVALRYSKIMESTQNIQQDLARTITTPTNALRILSAQWGVAQRYMGQFVSVIAAQVIPMVQTMVAVIAAAARALASLWGYALPSIPSIDSAAGAFSDVSDSLDDVGASAGGAGGKMKGLLADWDEINVIQSESGGGGGGGAAAEMPSIGDIMGLTGYTYDFLEGVNSKINDITTKLTDWWNKWAPSVKGLLSGLLTFVGMNAIGSIVSMLGKLSKGGKIAIGVASVVAGFTTLREEFKRIIAAGGDVTNLTNNMAVGLAELVGGGALIGGTVGGPIGAVIGGLVGLAGALLAYKQAQADVAKEKLAEDFRSLFGQIHLTKEEVNSLVETLYSTSYRKTISLELKGYEEAKKALTEAETSLQNITKDAWLIKLGVLDPEKYKDTFLSEVQTASDNLQTYVTSSGYSISLALGATFGEESAEVSTMNSIVSSNAQYLAGLGTQASEKFNEAFTAGLFSVEGIDAFKAGMEIVGKMDEIQQYINKVTRSAEYRAMVLSFDVTDLDYETAMEYVNQIHQYGEQQVSDILQDEALYIANLEAQKYVLDLQIADDPDNLELQSQRDYLENRINAWYAGTDPIKIQMDAEVANIRWQNATDIKRILGDRIDEFMAQHPEFQTQLELNTAGEDLRQAITVDVPYMQSKDKFINPDVSAIEAAINATWDKLNNLINRKGFFGHDVGLWGQLPDEAHKAIEAYLQSMRQYINADEKTVSEAREAGAKIPQAYLDGINEYYEYSALSGDEDAISYMVGKQYAMANSPDFIALLNSTSEAGAMLSGAFGQGFINNLTIDQNDLGQWYVGFADGQKILFADMSENMKQNFATMGLDVSKYVDGVASEFAFPEKPASALDMPTPQIDTSALDSEIPDAQSALSEAMIPDTTVSPDVTVKPELSLEQSASDIATIQQEIQEGVEQNMQTITAEAVVDVQTEVPIEHVDGVIAIEPIIPENYEIPPVTVDGIIDFETPSVEDLKSALSRDALARVMEQGESLQNYIDGVLNMSSALYESGQISYMQKLAVEKIHWWLNGSDAYHPDPRNMSINTLDGFIPFFDWLEQEMSVFESEDGQGLPIPLGAETSQLDDTLSGSLTYVQDTWNPGMVEAATFSIPAPDTSAARAELNSLYQYAQSIYSAMGGIRRKTSGGGGGGRVSYVTVRADAMPSTPTFTIPAYASGGFPKEGQLFLANEQAPELVGQIGSRTAVANDSQIVEGISGGVERANSRLERKMDEFISIARQLVAKDSRVVIEPSAALGKVNQRSAEMYQRARG